MPEDVKKPNTDLPEDQTETLTPLEWLNSLVEQNQEDPDFIVNANAVRDLMSNTKHEELLNRITVLDNENKELKEKFFKTFMGTDVPEHIEVDEVEEKPPLTITDILNSVK